MGIKALDTLTESQAAETEEFIFKLAQADSISDKEAVEAIQLNLKRLKKSRYFPEVFTEIDPRNNYSRTKLIDEKAKKRLEKAINEYKPN